MAIEIRNNQNYQGVALQEAVKQQLYSGFDQAVQMRLPEMVAYVSAIQNHFSDFTSEIDWNNTKTESEVRTIVGSTIAAMHLAYVKAGLDFETLYGLSHAERWWNVIHDVLNNNDTKQVFLDNMWRSPMVVFPSRGVPLQYLLRHHFGESPIRGLDLGAGLHIALPLLNTPIYLDQEFPGKNEIEHYSRSVNIVTGLGIDKQDRRSALDWAKACYWPIRENLGSACKLENLYREVLAKDNQFPFLVADVLDRKNCIRRVREIVGQDGRLDFVFSSFIRHQLGKDASIQSNFNELIVDLLRDGGVWIDLGAELIDELQYKSSSVRVFGMENRSLKLLGTPFVLTGQKYIQQVNLNYF